MTQPQPEMPDEEPVIMDDTAEMENAPEAMARALQVLLEQKESELAAAKDQTLRALAEAENTRRRAEREMGDMAKYAVTGFAKDLVNVIENLQRAVEAIPAELKTEQPSVATLATGVEMTLNELLNVFERQGIKRIDPMGQKFDHNYHQAVAQIETPDAPAGTVVQVLQAGYTIHDRLLRPAMVGVSAGAPKQVDTSA
jgi:molecular chaperone GrpE